MVTASRPKKCNLNNIRPEDSKHFKNKMKEYLKSKFMNLKITVTSKKSEAFIGEALTLGRVTSLELTE